MPRPPAKAAKTSLYRFEVPPEQELETLVQDKYLKKSEFSRSDVNVGDRPALLIEGVIPNPRPKWVDHAQSLTGRAPDVDNRTAAGLLLLRIADDSEYVYGLSWGMAHLIVNSSMQDEGFGLRFALRRADSNRLNGLTTHALDSVPRTARTSVLGGASLGAFGMEEIGEVLGRLIGRIPADGLSSQNAGGDNYISVKGADSLSLPLGKKPDALLKDLKYVDDVIRNSRPARGLEHLENTYPLRSGHPRIPELRANLASALDEPESRLALCWPAEWEEEFGEAHSYEIKRTGHPNEFVEELELDDVIDTVRGLPVDLRLDQLKSVRVQGLASGGAPLSRDIAADKWLTYEVDINTDRFVYHCGRWYNIGGEYLVMLKNRLRRIIGNQSEFALPAWPKANKKRKNGESYIGPCVEDAYNRRVLTGQDSGLLLMDKVPIVSEQHRRGFEACDAVDSEGTLFHVKRLDGSVAASHLFNQALVSAEALAGQPDARDDFVRKVSDLSGGSIILSGGYRPTKVVIAFAGGGTSTEEGLFTFSQVSLSRCALRLETMNIELQIGRIEETDEVLPDAS